MVPGTNKLETCVQELTRLVESFADQHLANKQALQELADDDPGAFCIAGIRLLAAAKVTPAVRYLVQLLTRGRMLTAGLLDPKTSSLPDALAASRIAVEAGAQLQSALEMALTQALQASTSPRNSVRILRILDLMAAAGAQSSWNSFQLELMAYPDKVVRSKAALLIGRNVKNIAWIGRRLMDRDPRVQASAVEALWGNSDPEARALLGVALKSKNNRVAANAALGLYRIADDRGVAALLEMMRHPDPAFQLSALWAIGQTEDPRFLPSLREQFPSAEGKTRLAIAGALSRILRRERDAANASPIDFYGARGWLESGGKRHLAFALSGTDASQLGGLTRTAFALWENQHLIENYDVESFATPAVILVGFVAPQFPSESHPYASAVREALTRCLAMKRSDDLWRIDRYAADGVSAAPEGDQAALPYDDAVITPEMKMRHGCAAAAGQIAKLIPAITPADRLASGLLPAIERQGQALGGHSGKRHVFVFLPERDQELTTEPAIARLKTLVEDRGLIFHAVSQDAPASWGAFRDFCLSIPEGTFEQVADAQLSETLAQSYGQLVNRYEINYVLPAADPGPVVVKVSSAHASGQVEFILAAPLAPHQPASVLEPVNDPADEPVGASTQ